MRRSLFLGLAWAAAMSAIGVAAAAAQPAPLFLGDAALRAQYALPTSKFMDIDGEPVHYVDQGHGPAIVLLHGSFGSLRQWEDWVKALSGRYRVIRLDLSPQGLSGPNPKGDYGGDRRLEIIDRLTRKLGAEHFILVATSSSGIAGAAYAAEHPDRVKALILNNIAVDHVSLDPNIVPESFKAARADDLLHKDHHDPEFWRQVFLLHFADPSKITPAMVQEWTDLNNRALRMPPATKSAADIGVHSRTLTDLPRITMPTLLLWSDSDKEVAVEKDGRLALSMIPAQDKALVIIPHCGHMMPLECGAQGVALATPFLDRMAPADR